MNLDSAQSNITNNTHYKDLRSEISSYLAEHNSMVLATVGGDKPWAAAVFYVHDRSFNLYFLSEDSTRHSSHILTNGRVAATVNEDPDDWKKIRGIQLEGTASKVTSAVEKAKVLALYLRKFPFVRSFLISQDRLLTRMVIGGKAVSFSIYRLKPERVFYLDNRKGFSHREELRLGAKN
ncbi:MAG: pyridoxamine 5'-phosphate oxidase family protein [Dehalococcoidia bacterium]|nr:pyridoxamine 5'-phosphate oxidase family protein [Dehalococcoidia bacterium]